MTSQQQMPMRGIQEELPSRRQSSTIKVTIGGQTVYFTIANYPDGRPAECFIHAARIGTFTRGALDAVGLLIAKSLQFGMPVDEIIKSFRYSKFDPQGVVTGDNDIVEASSILDYLAQRFILDYPN